MCVIAKTSFALGEKMSLEKLDRKILRFLPKRFDMKVTAIEEVQEITTIKVDEIIGYLQTFKVAINYRTEEENKNIAFVSNTWDDEDQYDT